MAEQDLTNEQRALSHLMEMYTHMVCAQILRELPLRGAILILDARPVGVFSGYSGERDNPLLERVLAAVEEYRQASGMIVGREHQIVVDGRPKP